MFKFSSLALSPQECQKISGSFLKLIFSLPMSASDEPATPAFSGAARAHMTLLARQESAMTFRPLHDRVAVRRLDQEERTRGGIIIPDTAKEKPQEGEVIAVGPGSRDERGELVPLDVKVGDRVLFGKWSGNEVKIDGDDILIMKESDIMGVLDAAALRQAA
jgi:chaperonin GroES